MACPACEKAAAEIKKLTVGMAVADDFATASMTIQSLRMHHGMTPDELEILVVDNKPYSPQGLRLKTFCEQTGSVYVSFPDPVGTAPPHNEIFQRATGQVVCAIDSHVLLELGTLQKLMAFARANPFNQDLWHGPLLYDRLGDDRNDHLEPKWGTDLMYGVWDMDERSKDPNGPPFEIPMHGMGLSACLKSAWLGIPDGLRGFGGTEGMLHEMFRQHNRKILCLPFLRWWHLFRGDWSPNPNPPLTEDKFRNYLIWHKHLALDTTELISLFQTGLHPSEFNRAIEESEIETAITLDVLYQRAVQQSSYINEHVPTLRRLALDCEHITEIVDTFGPSTVAFLSGKPDGLLGYLTDEQDWAELKAVVGDGDVYRSGDVLLPTSQQRDNSADLLFIGNCRTAERLEAVLSKCASWSRRWLVIAGTKKFSFTGEDGKSGLNEVLSDFLRAHTHWTVVESHAYNNGLLVLSSDERDKRPVPVWWEKGMSLLKASIKYAAAGKPDVDDVTFDLRVSACLMCEHRNGNDCGLCGCPIESKAMWATEDCAVVEKLGQSSKWPPLVQLEPTPAPSSTGGMLSKPDLPVEVQELMTLAAAIKNAPCRHTEIATEVSFAADSSTEATIQMRCMACGAKFGFDDRAGDTKPTFKLTPLMAEKA